MCDVAAKERDESERVALILYGSETGNSEDAAYQLGDIVERHRFTTFVHEMDAVELSQICSATIVIFVTSTTGQGDFPENSRKFWRSLLRKRLSATCLKQVSFTTFGLGDSSYKEYNFATKKLYKRLLQLGAHEFYPHGEGDEQHDEGTDGDFIRWSSNLRYQLLELYPLPKDVKPIPAEEFIEPKEWVEVEENEGYHVDESKSPVSSEIPPDDLLPIPSGLTATVVKNERMTAENHFQDVRLLQLSLEGDHAYVPGDIVTLYPKNFPTDVSTLIKLQNWESIADKPIAIKSLLLNNSSISNTFTPPSIKSRLHHLSTLTLRSLLIHNLDITTVPRRAFLRKISQWTSDPDHAQRLLEFSNPAFTDEFYDYVTRPRRTILEILADFSTVQIPHKYVLDVFPLLRGRQFSIASAYQSDEGRNTTEMHTPIHGSALRCPTSTVIDLTISLLTYRTILRATRHGLCSRYIGQLSTSTPIIITLQKGSYPSITKIVSSSKPLVLVGPGTGIAPLRSLLLARKSYVHSLKSDSSYVDGQTKMGKTILIFGNRQPEKDFLFSTEWTNLQSDASQNFQILTAWSRVEPISNRKYVQDVIRERAETIVRMLKDEGGMIFICGSAGKMPVGVKVAVKDCFMEVGGIGELEAEGEIGKMAREGRWIQETW